MPRNSNCLFTIALVSLLVSASRAETGRTLLQCVDGRPFSTAAPFSGLEMQVASMQMDGAVAALGLGVQSGADHIISQQCPNGGFTWEHIPPSDCTTTYYNITAPILLGVLDGYPLTANAGHLEAAKAGGAYEQTSEYGNGEARFGAFSPYFLMRLTTATGDSQFSDYAAGYFFDELSAGTYGPADLNTAGWIAAVQAGRSGSLINLRPWEFHTLINTATAIGNAGQDVDFLQGLLDGLDTLDNTSPFTVYYDLLGLAGGVRGLAMIGTTSFSPIQSPNFPEIDGISTLEDLADVLAGYQNANGSWYWASAIPGPINSDEDTQTTAYAILALAAADSLVSSDYSSAIAKGRNWVRTMQIPGGGVLTYPGGGENTEVEGEALSALAPDVCMTDILEFKLGPGSQCVQPGEPVVVELYQRGLDQVVRGFQAFTEFDDTVLTFGSGSYTTSPYGLPVISPIAAVGGNIDLAAGINNLGGQLPTMADARLVVLNFTAGGLEGPTVVNFRPHDPPTRFSDAVGNEVVPCLIESPTILVDGTGPAITCPVDVTVECAPNATLPANSGFPTVSDNLDGAPVITYTDSVAGAACPQISIVTRTWWATDCSGNFSTCEQTITVADKVAPELHCPPDVTVECDESTLPADTGVPSYFQGFEDPGFIAPPIQTGFRDWQQYYSSLIRVASGTDGIVSKSGGFHGVIDSSSLPGPPNNFSGAFSPLGGYTSNFGDGFSTSLDVYMDLTDPAVAGDTYGWDLSSAVSFQAGTHRRDFVFHTASNASGEILVGGSNNSNFTRRNDLASINHYTITASDWYTFQWIFRDSSGVLSVDLNLLDSAGTLLWTETLSTPADLIASVIGGNRYMWFTFLEAPTLAIDNTVLLGIAKALDDCDPAPVVDYSDDSTPGPCAQGSSIARTWSATDACGSVSTCVQTITVEDTTDPVLTVPPDAIIECDNSNVPDLESGIPYGTIEGGIMVRYNTGSEVPGNEAYMRAQFSQTNDNGAAFTFSSSPLTGSGLTWSLLYGQVGPPTQFGFDMVLKIDSAVIPIPYPMAFDNTDNTIAGRAAAGPVRWMIDDYKPLVDPIGPANPGNEVINCLIRSVTPPNLDPLVDAEIFSLSLVETPPLTTMTISGVLHSDGIHHWFTVGTPESPMANYFLNGDFYFTGTLVYDATADITPGGRFYEGTIDILANAPSAGSGFALATDNCDLFPLVSYIDTPDLDECNGTGEIIRTWSAVDACGNSDEVDQVIEIVDTTPPMITSCPANMVIYPPAGGCAATMVYSLPEATDNCGTPVVNCVPPSGTVVGTGVTIVTCTATDDCGNSGPGSVCSFDVTVEPFNRMDVAVQLSPTMAPGPFDRCITFEFRDCPDTALLATSTHLVTFSNGTSGVTTIDVPCGDYSCVSARDRQHTLRRTDEALAIFGPNYAADFTLSPPEGDWLTGGNLNDDEWIDMLDFGLFSAEFLTEPTPVAACPALPPVHADINSDGVVDNLDFTFIRNNFLMGHETNCCSALNVASLGDGPIERISVRELRRRGLDELTAGDLNADGWLDILDIEAFARGIRPRNVKTPDSINPNKQPVRDVSHR